MSATVSVFPQTPDDGPAAQALAARYGLPYHHPDCDLQLIFSAQGLSLQATHGELAGGRAVTCNWSKRDVISPMGARLTQPLFKAIGLHKGDAHRPHVIDATAGLGEDSHQIAATGCQVTALERCAVLDAMLEDAAKRYNPTIKVVHTDATQAIPDGEVVYLDPMFPAGRKTVEKKKMRILRWLVGDDPDADELLKIALSSATKRVVVKRPMRAEPLCGLLPKVSHKGQAVRYDVYIPAEVR